MRITFQRESTEANNNNKEDRISLEPVPPPKGILYYNSPLKELSLQYNWGLDTQAWCKELGISKHQFKHTLHTYTQLDSTLHPKASNTMKGEES